MSRKLDSLFHPSSILLVGGSRDPSSMGGTLVRNLLDSYDGPLFFVHPLADSFDGRPVHRSLNEVGRPVDLAIIAVPAPRVEESIKGCLDLGSRAIVVISAGFAETGSKGREIELRWKQMVDAAGVTLLGPNCLGLLNHQGDHAFNATFSLASPARGTVAVCTQSGALGFVFPDYMKRHGLGLGQLVSLGNKLSVGENDVLEQWADDEQIRVVQLYLESFQEPRRFVEVARRISRSRPLVTLWGGRTDGGARAAGSHTAALASPAALMRAAMRKSGAVLTESLEELFDVTAQLALQPLPRGNRVAVLTNAGGPGVLCVDALTSRGLLVPDLSPDLQLRLRSRLPPHAAVGNPVDLVGSTSPTEFSECLTELMRCEEIDHVVVMYVPRIANSSAPIAAAIRAVVARERQATIAAKSISAVFLDAAESPIELRNDDLAIPCFAFPECAARALSGALRYAQWRQAMDAEECGSTSTACLSSRPTTEASDRIDAYRFEGDGWQDPTSTAQWLATTSLQFPAWGIAQTVDEARDLVERLGGRVTMKVIAPGILHKGRRGGVKNDVRSPDEVRLAFRSLMALAPDVQGVLIQAYEPGDWEVFLGVRRDPRFGLVVGCGMGGTHVEQLDNVSFAMLPLDSNDIDSLVSESGWLRRWRNDPSLVESLSDVVRTVCELTERTPGLVEADFNPIALSSRQPPRLLDVRVRIDRSSPPR